MLKIALILAAFFLTFIGVELFRRWSLRRNILDVPNERSSHVNPTPVGGGVIIVCICIGLYLAFLVANGFEIPFQYFAGALVVAAVSWLDDIFSVPVVVRFVCHGAAAGLIIWGLGDFSFGFFSVISVVWARYLTIVFLFFWIVWMINSYNFMDGIDGLAAIQAITAGVCWMVSAGRFGLDSVGFLAAVLTVSSLGFLILNWQPAKIFMGDVGSAFLGFTFAFIPLSAQKESPADSSQYFFIGLLAVWFFLFDTVVTLLFRLLQGKKFWKAHREHLYQRLVIRGYSHRFVACLYGILSVILVSSVQIWFAFRITYFVPAFITLILSIAVFIFARKNVIFERSFRD